VSFYLFEEPSYPLNGERLRLLVATAFLGWHKRLLVAIIYALKQIIGIPPFKNILSYFKHFLTTLEETPKSLAALGYVNSIFESETHWIAAGNSYFSAFFALI